MLELTSNDLEILRLAALPIKEISCRLHLSESATKSRLNHMMARVNAPNRLLAQIKAIKKGLITIEEIVTE